MKRFCTQCGKELKSGINICPTCGHHNKNKSKRKGVTPLLILILVFTSLFAVLGVYKRDLITDVINTVKARYTELKDPDFTTKYSFKEHYEKYIVESDYLRATYGYLNYDNNDTIQLLGVDTLENQRGQKLSEIESSNCFQKVNLDESCTEKFRELSDIQQQLSIQITDKQTEYRFCGNDRKDFIPKCQSYIDNWLFPSFSDCESCNNEIQEMYTNASKLRDSDMSKSLLSLVTELRVHNEFKNKLMDLRSQIEQKKSVIGINEGKKAKINRMSESEIKAKYGKLDTSKSFISTDLPSLYGKPATKTNILEGFNSIIVRMYADLEPLNDDYDKLFDELELQIKLINDQISILNGVTGLGLTKL